jgi:RHS repeat-associated protein
LGNVRLSYAKNPTTGNLDIIEENNYYPFGLRHIGYNNDLWLTHGNGEAQKYKYNDREYQSELGLNVTAMDFRQYDAALGRFNCIDALAASMPSSTPYHFGFSNPVYWADPSGLLPEWLQSMWDATPRNGTTHWVNDGFGNFNYAGDYFGGSDPRLVGSFVDNQGQFHGGGGGSGSYIIYNGNPDAGLLHTVVVQAYKSKGVGQPKGWETAIPVWGSGRAAVDHFQNGNYWRGIGYTALAISDVFLVKSAVTAIGRGIAVGVSKITAKNAVAKGVSVELSVAEQAANLSKRLNKNSFIVDDLGDGMRMQYDFLGATHKGVPTPHVQMWKLNVNPITGAEYYNKVSKFVIPMTQKHINYLDNYISIIGY